MAGFRHEERKTEMSIKEFITEMIYVGFLVLFSLNFTMTSNTERFAILIIVEVTFVGTKVYCKAKNENKKGEKRYESKKNDKRNN